MKIDRIRKTKDFQDVFKNGKKFRGKLFSLYAWKGAGSSETAAGAAVAKKFARTAVKRNYIKRAVYTVFRGRGGDMQRGVKIVVRLSCGVKDIKKRTLSKEIRKDIEELLLKAGIIQ
ncbi:MAG: ribonuclease P protein component [Candidatus Omnitrophota bacterium]